MNAVTKAQEKAEPIEVVQEEDGRITAPQPAPATQPKKKKNNMRVVLMLVLPLALAAGGTWWWITSGRYQETEDAYLQQP